MVPKGLRSFDGEDADFFLALLPGPKDRDGLPDSLRYWKKRIEAVTGFQVGVMYGPSGCGKSSLVKAGLIPNLDSQKTVALYLESSPQETEGRLKAGVMKSCGIEDRDVSLADLFFFIRNGRYQPLRGKKLVLVIDQFEQWLHEKNGMYHGELAQALGQCDGTHIQALLLVRDDFWMATTRFMNHLEVELVPEENLQGVDLFDLGHAEKVLTAIGRAQEKLPEYPKHIRSAQKKFVLQAVEELSQENRVITVRLTLFAEMMKHRDWTIESLRAVGGVGGLGFTFLEETFEGKHAPPENRLHQPLCKAILLALLPADAVEITGARLSLESLLTQSGSEDHPKEFSTALRILEKDAVVRILPNRGAHVTQLSIPEVEDIFEIRRTLNGVMHARLSAEEAMALAAIIEGDVRKLETLAQDVDGHAYAETIFRLGGVIRDACTNRRLADILAALARQTLRYTQLGLATAVRRKQSARNWRSSGSAS